MRLGVDFGTTHTVAALVDRGNYPVVAFEGVDTWPSLAAAGPGGELRFGPDAAAVKHVDGWTVLRSFKRLLDEAGPLCEIEIGERSFLLADVVAGFLGALREDLAARSNAGIAKDERLETAISVPANASSAQRFLTLDAFTRAGFEVVALLNEPSAAGFEYAHRYRATISGKREYVVVYDLGGGTFDASLLKMTGRLNEVVTSEGVRKLGGDDFDEAILAHVLKSAGVKRVPRAARELLLEEVARQKEAVGANTKRFLLDLAPIDRAPFACPIDEVYAACAPLVARTIKAVEPVLRDPSRGADDAVDWSEVAGIYIAGGAGTFPLVPRLLKEAFGEKRVKRSPHPFAATAMGLAVFLDKEAGYELSERLTRHFGVFREASSGGDVVFDPIFPKDAALPAPGAPPLTTARRYRAVHNIGRFRFVECGRLTDGTPDGDVSPYPEVLFPFDRELRAADALAGRAVVRLGEGPEVEERYSCDASGAVSIEVVTLDDGYTRSFRLARP
jgi:molecular chaperone DnaK (HSP70)